MLVKGLLTQMSGSAGGITATHNRGGLVLRARAIPVNPNTALQQMVRSWMAAVSARWQAVLTEDQREAWNNYAANMPTTGRLGDQIYPTGQNQYVRANVARLNAGLDYVDEGPTEFVLPTFTIVSTAFTETPNKINITYVDTEDWCAENGAALLVYASRPFAPTINYFNGPYQYLTRIDGSTVSPPTSPASLDPTFPFVAGQQVGIRLALVRADGRMSADFRDRGVAA